ncbi:hypothetical protein HacjB3_18658 (plasmid) [Halalkalicoccus jeotgali B3]|uniref:Uncharacterized protein n=1 Tax=Halalkalicoccus jeotgali (strain DSM 18796 / CECT 7217 / JCM 14584 / KCTC 4019 / B3) TaxID=795797 RepID=D8JCG4_HALJB|nr:hypothetical protein HacjB3_18658 [Halalkalicoccus jeotgali B3]
MHKLRHQTTRRTRTQSRRIEGVIEKVTYELLHVLAVGSLGYYILVQIYITTLLDWRVSGITYGKFQTQLETTLITLVPLMVLTPLGITTLIRQFLDFRDMRKRAIGRIRPTSR